MRPVLALVCVLASLSTARAADTPHWAYQKPRAGKPPTVKNAAWVRNPIDAFVLARLERAGLTPSAEADRETLLRRVTYDLTGLPPTPEERLAFLRDRSPDAYEKVVERLLASPHHGERWAQHWLDVVRFAESNGYELNSDRPHAWRYRDWVVKAINDDVPYDRFLTEQLAGDLLAKGKPPREAQALLIATGFHRCGQQHVVGGNVDPAETRQELLNEMTSGLSAFVGLTLACARCHDHKFDPISQAEYYQFEAFFAGVQQKDVELATAEEKAEQAKKAEPLQKRIAEIKRQVAAIDAPYRARIEKAKHEALEPEYKAALAVEASKRTPEQIKLVAHAKILTKVTWDEVLDVMGPDDLARRKKLREEMHGLEARLPPPPAHAWSVTEKASVPETFVLRRGDYKRKGDKVLPGFPAVFDPDQAEGRLDRLALAKWLTEPEHPLTARVMVNRLWQHHFGRGLVATPNDFGIKGARPTHPELLDWLATELMRRKWSLREMHRLMVLSSTYRQASDRGDARAAQADPDNQFLWRMNRRRLEAEALRDGVLAATGSLNRKVGGPSVRVPLEPEVYDLIFTEGEPDGLWMVTPDASEHSRRSLYLFNKRNVRLPLLEALDQPDTLNPCPVRPVSTYAPQALILLNGPFMQEQSRAFAARLLRDSTNPERLIDQAYPRALGRTATEREHQFGKEFLAEQSEFLRDRLRARLPVNLPPGLADEVDPALAAALVDYCLALLNSNEFVHIR